MVRRLVHSALLAVLVVAATACNLQLSTDVEAKDTLTRSFPISATGTLVIKNGNGKIDVSAGDTQTIEVVIERVIRAGNETTANEQLKAYDIAETVTADQVTLDSTTRGLQISVSRRANYTVRVPKGLAVTLESSNGEVIATGIGGAFSASASNGRIRATSLGSSAKVSTTNGVIDVEMAALSGAGVTAETTNGQVTISIPRSSNADVSARVTNGAISHDGLDMQVIESSRRRLDGRVGTGGVPVRIETTNGAVRLVGR